MPPKGINHILLLLFFFHFLRWIGAVCSTGSPVLLAFLLVFEVYRLAHKSFAACGQLLLLALFSMSTAWPSINCCALLPDIETINGPFRFSGFPFYQYFYSFCCCPDWDGKLHWVGVGEWWVGGAVVVPAISLCSVDCCTGTIRLVIYIVQDVKGLTKSVAHFLASVWA